MVIAKYKSGCRNKLYLLSYADYLETKVFSGISVTVTYLTSSSYSYSNTVIVYLRPKTSSDKMRKKTLYIDRSRSIYCYIDWLANKEK
jgi:hypothetical protein